MSTRRNLVEPDVDIIAAPVDESVRRWPKTAVSGSPSPDSICRSSFSLKPKDTTLSSVAVSRAMQMDDQLVATTPKDEARRACRRHKHATLSKFQLNL